MASQRVVLAHEMGAGWGHFFSLRGVAEKFIRCGYDVFLLSRGFPRAERVFTGTGVKVVSSPAWTIRKSCFSLNYAQCIWGNGWWSLEEFQAHLQWWFDAFVDLQPDFVFTDFAPTALLAAQAFNLPRGLWGTGFAVPPSTIPLPGIHPWLPIERRHLLAAEAPVLERMQQVIPEVRGVAELFSGAERFLTVFPESDHFQEREGEPYWGPVLHGVVGKGLDWPTGEGPRVFAYLNRENRCLEKLLTCLRDLGWPTFACVQGFSENDCREQGAPTLRISPLLADMNAAVHGAELAVTQGGIHTSMSMMLAGVPVMMLPEQLEQAVLAYRLQRRGLSEWISPWTDCDKMAERLQRLRSSRSLAANVSDFAEKYADYDADLTLSRIVETCLDVMQ